MQKIQSDSIKDREDQLSMIRSQLIPLEEMEEIPKDGIFYRINDEKFKSSTGKKLKYHWRFERFTDARLSDNGTLLMKNIGTKKFEIMNNHLDNLYYYDYTKKDE